MRYAMLKLIALTVQKIQFYVININPQGSKSHGKFHIYNKTCNHTILDGQKYTGTMTLLLLVIT